MNLPVQHLSDEAIAACADGVLPSGAAVRADRHLATCAECADEVRVQREAMRALRGAGAPALPNGLLDRLRSLPMTTPLTMTPVVMGEGGTPMFPAFGTSVLDPRPTGRERGGRARFGSRSMMLAGATTALAVGFVGVSSGPVAAHGTTAPIQRDTIQRDTTQRDTTQPPAAESAERARSSASAAGDVDVDEAALRSGARAQAQHVLLRVPADVVDRLPGAR